MLQHGFPKSQYEFLWEPSFANADADDEHWAAIFRKFGGRVIVTGDKNIAKRPHQLEAFREIGLIGFVFDKRWAGADLAHKCASLVHWWHRIGPIAVDASPGDFWWVPMGLSGELRPIPRIAEADRGKGWGKKVRRPAKS